MSFFHPIGIDCNNFVTAISCGGSVSLHRPYKLVLRLRSVMHMTETLSKGLSRFSRFIFRDAKDS